VDDRGWQLAQVITGVWIVMKDAEGKDVLDNKSEPARKTNYVGLTRMRHVCSGAAAVGHSSITIA
jgi:hypothetical protein